MISNSQLTPEYKVKFGGHHSPLTPQSTYAVRASAVAIIITSTVTKINMVVIQYSY